MRTWYRYWAHSVDGDASAFHVKHSAERPVSEAAGEGSGDADRHPDLPTTTLVIANQKGGVGKTTTAVSLGAALAHRGRRILLVDLDPQGNASSGLGLRPSGGQTTTYEVLVEDADVKQAIVETAIPQLHLLPSSVDLAGAEIELVSAFSREQRLRRALSSMEHLYDLIVVDCPPSLGLLTVNALTAGSAVLVPIQCEYYALEGLGSLQQNIELIRLHLNPHLRTIGYVMTMHDGRTRLSEQVVEEVRAHFGDAVFDTRIPRSVRLAEAPSYGEPITVFDPASRGAVAYHRVATELMKRLARTTVKSGREG